ncbi:MAG: hydrogenase expression/formation protein HypE [Fimbriimonadia bacterium]|jgi:hydrogenase expression/formation protein HypE
MRNKTVTTAHGSGGKASRELLESVFLPHLPSRLLAPLSDQALLPRPEGRVAFTTDSFVVKPLFFPGGDIGKLAVCGTVNDLAVGGAVPNYLACSFILEEGLPVADLQRVVRSLAETAREAGVEVVTGDTKVVERGAADGMFITTTGLGVVPDGLDIGAHRIEVGDVLLLSGHLADHGITLFCLREGIDLASDAVSDCAPLGELCSRLVSAAGDGLHAMRDPTRGGLATAVVEMANSAGVSVEMDEAAIPVRDAVRSACEVLGFDPLTVANEGKVVAFVSEDVAPAALEALRSHPLGRDAAVIGHVVPSLDGLVWLNTPIGGQRIVDLPAGELLPRIC